MSSGTKGSGGAPVHPSAQENCIGVLSISSEPVVVVVWPTSRAGRVGMVLALVCLVLPLAVWLDVKGLEQVTLGTLVSNAYAPQHTTLYETDAETRATFSPKQYTSTVSSLFYIVIRSKKPSFPVLREGCEPDTLTRKGYRVDCSCDNELMRLMQQFVDNLTSTEKFAAHISSIDSYLTAPNMFQAHFLNTGSPNAGLENTTTMMLIRTNVSDAVDDDPNTVWRQELAKFLDDMVLRFTAQTLHANCAKKVVAPGVRYDHVPFSDWLEVRSTGAAAVLADLEDELFGGIIICTGIAVVLFVALLASVSHCRWHALWRYVHNKKYHAARCCVALTVYFLLAIFAAVAASLLALLPLSAVFVISAFAPVVVLIAVVPTAFVYVGIFHEALQKSFLLCITAARQHSSQASISSAPLRSAVDVEGAGTSNRSSHSEELAALSSHPTVHLSDAIALAFRHTFRAMLLTAIVAVTSFSAIAFAGSEPLITVGVVNVLAFFVMLLSLSLILPVLTVSLHPLSLASEDFNERPSTSELTGSTASLIHDTRSPLISERPTTTNSKIVAICRRWLPSRIFF